MEPPKSGMASPDIAWSLSVPQVALAWVLHQDLDIYALNSPRTAEECQINAAVFDIELTAEEIEWLNLERAERP